MDTRTELLMEVTSDDELETIRGGDACSDARWRIVRNMSEPMRTLVFINLLFCSGIPACSGGSSGGCYGCTCRG